ncbi:MAG: hypothetical protein Q4B46_08820 [Comamonadaceae bacterium]|nr:hypothetical protein [Comamonadaceae bacterium]
MTQSIAIHAAAVPASRDALCLYAVRVLRTTAEQWGMCAPQRHTLQQAGKESDGVRQWLAATPCGKLHAASSIAWGVLA